MAKVAAASKASSMVVARVTPAWRHMPSNTRSSVASEPVWLRGGALAARGGPALHEHERLGAAATSRQRARRSARPSATPSTYARPTAVTRVARRTSRGSRRRRPRRRCPRDTARLTPTPVCVGVVHERRHEVARLAGDRDRGPAVGTGRRSGRRARRVSTPRLARWGRRAGSRARRPAPPARLRPARPCFARLAVPGAR